MGFERSPITSGAGLSTRCSMLEMPENADLCLALSQVRNPNRGSSPIASTTPLSGSHRLPDPRLGPSLHGVPRAPERRGVGQVEVAHGVDRHPVEDGGSGDVDPLGHLGIAVTEELDAEEPARRAVTGVAHPDPLAARVVRLVVVGLAFDGHRIEAGDLRLVVTHPGT